MREIKFRFFDKETLSFIDFDNDYNYDYVITSSGLAGKVYNDSCQCALSILDSVIISQYTGLKDKNGKDIYFKDIVKAPSGNTFIVDWNEDEMRIALKRLNSWWNFNVGLYEVIGNIYQNPELCK